MKKLANTILPYFNTKVRNTARFFFGTHKLEVEIFDVLRALITYINDNNFDAHMDSSSYGGIVISKGIRNDTMSHYDCLILNKFLCFFMVFLKENLSKSFRQDLYEKS